MESLVSEEQRKSAELAIELYNQRWKSELERTHLGEFVAINPDSKTYHLGPTYGEAVDAARAVAPALIPLVLRVGSASTYVIM